MSCSSPKVTRRGRLMNMSYKVENIKKCKDVFAKLKTEDGKCKCYILSAESFKLLNILRSQYIW